MSGWGVKRIACLRGDLGLTLRLTRQGDSRVRTVLKNPCSLHLDEEYRPQGYMATRQKGGEKASMLARCGTSRFPQHAAIVVDQVELLTPADGGGWGDNRGIKKRGPVRGADKRSNEEMMLKKTVERQSREATKSGVAAVFIMVLIGAIMMTNIYFKDAFLNKNLREKFHPQRIQAQELQVRMNQAKVVRGYIKDRMVTLDIIHELYAMTPHTIYLNTVTMDEDGTVTIDGISDSMSQVFSYVKALDDSAMFKEAKTKSTSTKKDNGKDVAAFEIEFKLDSVKETPAPTGPKPGGPA